MAVLWHVVALRHLARHALAAKTQLRSPTASRLDARCAALIGAPRDATMNELRPIGRSERGFRLRLAAIAFLDVVDYSRMMGRSEEATLVAWSILRTQIIEPRIIAWRGRVVDRAGDGIFAEFGSALDALRWAMEAQAATERHAHVGEPIRLRIALHLADVIDGPDGEVHGDGVNITARLQSRAEAGGLIVSRAIVDAVVGKVDASFIDLGPLHLKNIARPVHAFRLDAARPAAASPSLRRRRRVLSALGVVAIVLLCLAPLIGWRAAPREEAERLVREGRAIACAQQPCPRTWLARRALFEQAIAIDPTFAKPYAEAAFTYTNFVTSHLSADSAGDLRAAAVLATRAVALAPDQAFAQEARAAVLRQDADKLEGALSAYLRAMALDPSRPALRANAGWMLVLLGRPAEAETYLRGALESDPHHIFAPAWLTYLGLAELFLDRPGHGSEFFRRAVAQQPKSAAGADIDLERRLNLVAALALDGQEQAARATIDALRTQYPTLSTGNLLWNCACSHAPGFLKGVTKLRQGLVLAGAPDTD